jgi:hypothetical protein
MALMVDAIWLPVVRSGAGQIRHENGPGVGRVPSAIYARVYKSSQGAGGERSAGARTTKNSMSVLACRFLRNLWKT